MINIKVIGTPLYQWESGRKIQITPLPNMRVDAVHFSNFGDTEALVVKPREENGNIIADIPNILLQSGANLVVYTVNGSQDSVETLVECTISVRSRAKPADYVYTETEVLTITTAVEKALLEAKESGEFNGKDGANGKDGLNGKDGVSVSHKWNGTTLEINSASGTSSADLKGEKGDAGEKGEKGDKGEVDYSLVANAIKGTASGSAVAMTDVSPLEHNVVVKLSSDTLSDFTAVTLTKQGKNLFNDNKEYEHVITLEENGEKVFAHMGYQNPNNKYNTLLNFDITGIWDIANKLNLPVTISYDIKTAIDGQVQVYTLGKKRFNTTSASRYIPSTTEWQRYRYTATPTYVDADTTGNNGCGLTFFGSPYGSGIIPFIKNLQIEIGTEETPYAKFQVHTYQPKKDGVVEGVTSLYPTTTLLTDNADVTITAEYNKDTNKVVENLVNAIISLGGNV